MEVFLYNSTICRLCGEENDNGSLLYSCEENNSNLSEVINTYLPLKVSDDGQLPRTICPGCTIQLEATVEFLTLIINGQKIIRELHLREREYKKTILIPAPEQDVITEQIVYEVNTSNGVYQIEHPMTLQVAGLDKPKRKRGRPPKKLKTAEELAQQAAAKEKELKSPNAHDKDYEPSGKRRRKTPTRFKDVVQGKELERIFKEEGVTDGEESDRDLKPKLNIEVKIPAPKEPEIIGHMEDSGEVVVFVKGKGRGRPKGPMRLTRKECAICGMEFSCSGRYMSHVAHHGPVIYQCSQCNETFDTQLNFSNHQKELGHVGKNVIPCGKKLTPNIQLEEDLINYQKWTIMKGRAELKSTAKLRLNKAPYSVDDSPALKSILLRPIENVPMERAIDNSSSMRPSVSSTSTHPVVHPSDIIKMEPPGSVQSVTETPDVAVNMLVDNVMTALPDLSVQPVTNETNVNVLLSDNLVTEITSSPSVDSVVKISDTSTDIVEVSEKPDAEQEAAVKARISCPHCDKTFSNKQSKSLHIKATHKGERPYACGECGAHFAYPRSLALHAVSHRRRRLTSGKGFACDLCGKVLNHPSSVVYHKEAEHAGQRYVCNKCGKSFKHKQLLQRHQLVHSQVRPYTCKTCDSSFKTKANLFNHQLLHTGIKKFSCELCKQRFAHKASLTLHMRWHTGQKPYSCTTCGKSFSQKGNLSEHLRIHTGEKPFQCALCPRRFTTSSQHRLHARWHAAERPHACAHCGKRFASRAACAAHVRREAAAGARGQAAAGARRRPRQARWPLLKAARAPERPFRCPHCPRAFADGSNLNKHKKQVHKQISLLANSQPQPQQIQQTVVIPKAEQVDVKLAMDDSQEDSLEERVIYVTYDVDEPDSPAFHILSPEQVAGLDETKVLTTCELYSGPSLLVPQPELEQLELEPEQLEQEELEQLQEQLVLDGHEHMPVTDEQGNPLHFTMQDGTRLAITSADGKSLQVITQDGQTIPVEINGYAEEEEVDSADTIVHQLNLHKSVERDVSAPVAHYFTIV